MSVLSAALVAAYRAAYYTVAVADGPALRLRVDEPCVALAALFTTLGDRGAPGATLVTACNPYGRHLSPEANTTAHARLCAHVRAQYPFVLDTVGEDPAREWPDEPGCLVFATDLPTALTLGREWQQNAVLFAEACDATPRLVLLR